MLEIPYESESKMSIFENGYLKPEYLNPQYRGLVGWPFMTWDMVNEKLNISSDNMVCITDTMVVTQGDDLYRRCDLRIEKFGPKDIPVGELVLIKYFRTAVWRLEKFAGITNYNPHDYIVPYLIAATPEEAEERKGWHK